MSLAKQKRDIVKNSIRRFMHLGNLTIARYILNSYGDLWENNLEAIRSSVRSYRGKNGEKNRKKFLDDSLYLETTPTKLPQTWRKIRTDYKLPPGVWLILSDLHIPFHEPMPIEAAVQAGHIDKIDGILLNGDFQDCKSITFWPTHTRRKFDKEIEATIDVLDWLIAEFPKAKIVYKPGNHEYRLPRYYITEAPEMIENPVSAMEAVIGFEERGIEFLDYFQKVYAGKLPIIHGHEVPYIQKMVNPARGLFLRTHSYCACSHCHMTSQNQESDISDKNLTTWSFGCACDLHPDWSPYGNRWNWGFGIINVEENGDFEVINRRVLPSGKVV